jgi:2-isopropylmalate synthase
MEGKDDGFWTVPYLPIDPKDLGRKYEGDVIRINSQSGKGGVSFILKTRYGLTIPKEMQPDVSYTMKGISDREHAELTPERIRDEFEAKYVRGAGVFQILECHFKQGEGILAELTILHGGKEHVIEASGNGRLDAVSNGLKQYFDITYELSTYEEHALSKGSSSKAIAYVGITKDNQTYWGVGNDEDIIRSSINALCVAVNQLEQIKELLSNKDERINAIINYIQENFLTVTLDDLSHKFYLSKPYLSKYIKEKSGKTFGENLKQVRLKKASTLLKNGNMKVERVAEASGYQNVEHFNRLFKKKYGMTPVQYRTSARN